MLDRLQSNWHALAILGTLLLAGQAAPAMAQSAQTPVHSFACFLKTDPAVPLLLVMPDRSDRLFEARGYEKVLCPSDIENVEASYSGFCEEGRALSERMNDRMKEVYGLSHEELCTPVKSWLKADKQTAVYAKTGRRVFKHSKGDLEKTPKTLKEAAQ